jgi:hypothetical protein
MLLLDVNNVSPEEVLRVLNLFGVERTAFELTTSLHDVVVVVVDGASGLRNMALASSVADRPSSAMIGIDALDR